MSSSFDLSPVPAADRTASWLDVALLFAGANVVSSTLIAGAALGLGATPTVAAVAMLLGVAIGTAPIALLARQGPSTGLPTMVLLRRPFGTLGAALVSLLLIVTNFAWFALNNVVAARAAAPVWGGSERFWLLLCGSAALLLCVLGQRAMALFDRAAVPMMAVVGVLLTLALVRTAGTTPHCAEPTISFWPALDLVIGYQVSWALMFADYTRFQRSPRAASWSVFLGLSVTSFWLLPVGAAAARQSGASDPGAMLLALGVPGAAALLVALSSLTTNFVNIYLSALALRNLFPRISGVAAVFFVGTVGTALGLVSGPLLDRFTVFVEWLATLLVPIVAIALLYYLRPRASLVSTGDRRIEPAWPGAVAWGVGVVAYRVLIAVDSPFGATLPTLLATAGVYALLRTPIRDRGTSGVSQPG